jgi:hypothetical protein
MKYIPFYASLLVFVHPALFIFGYSFGLILNTFSTYRKFTIKKKVNVIKTLFYNLAPLIFVIPYIVFNINFFGSFDQDEKIFVFNEFLLYLKAAIFYFILPLGLMLSAAQIFKVDPFELLVKFWPILLVGSIEFLIRTMHFFNILPINDLTIIDRVSVYFLHFLYFLPFLTIITRKFSYLPEINSRSKGLFKGIQKHITFLFKDLGVFYTTATIIYLSFITYSFIDHKPYKILNNRAQILAIEIPDIISNKLFAEKNIEFLSIDERIIVSFLFKNKNIPLNSFLQYGSLEQEIKFNFLEYIYRKNGGKISTGFLDGILDKNFDQNSFKNFDRNLNLLFWLKHNHAYNLHRTLPFDYENIEDEIQIFFDKNYLIHKNDFPYDIDFEKKYSKNIGSYAIIYF